LTASLTIAALDGKKRSVTDVEKMKRAAKFAWMLCIALVCVGMSGQAFAVHHAVGQHHRRHLRWLHWNPMFRPSHESLLIQNAEVDRLNLPRIQDETERRFAA
jgi:hypothetical protein